MAEQSDTQDAPRPELALWLAALFVTLAVLAIYARTVTFGYINLDDPTIFIHNPYLRGLTWANLRQILSPGATLPGEGLYIPLFYLITLVEFTLFDGHPWILHATNVGLHLGCCLMVLILLRRWLRDDRAATLAALLFALHPLQVEAVAWTMGRKDTLATLGALVAIWCYLRFREQGQARWFVLAMVAWVLGLLGKPSILLLPLVLAALDRWRGVHWQLADLGRAALMLVIALLIYWLNRSPGEGSTHWPDYTWLALLGVVGGWVQRFLLLAPIEFYYLKRDALAPTALTLWRVVPALVLLAWCFIALRHRWPRCLIGILLIAVAMAPTATVLFSQRDFVTADRYGYLAMVGACFAVGAGLRAVAGRWRHLYLCVLVLVLLGSTIRSAATVTAWQDSQAMWERILAQTPDHPVALVAYGNWLDDQGNQPAAAQYYKLALQADFHQHLAHTNLGQLLLQAGRPAQAARHCRYALAISPDHVDARYNLALALSQLGRWSAAAEQAQLVLTRAPDHDRARYVLGMALVERSRYDEAEPHLRQVATADPGFVGTYLELGNLYLQTGRLPEALAAYGRALELDDALPAPYIGLANVLLAAGQPQDALTPLTHALQRFPELAQLHRLQARALLALDRDGAAAAYRRSLELGAPPDPDLAIQLGLDGG